VIAPPLPAGLHSTFVTTGSRKRWTRALVGAFLGALLALSADALTQWPLAKGAAFVAIFAAVGFVLGFTPNDRHLERILRLVSWLG
jgi:hypothetical protein